MHKAHITSNELTGRPPYGYRVAGINCKQSPCHCWERSVEDGKTLAIYEPEARVIREAKDRYLNGESTHAICDDFNARDIPSPVWKGEPGKRWINSTLGRILRNPAIAGRRMNRAGKTILTYPEIITWSEHEELVTRLTSRAHRAGISPFNVTRLTGVLFDVNGHPMYRTPSHGNPRYVCRQKGCHIGAMMAEIDDLTSRGIQHVFGTQPQMVRRVVPGKNHFEEIARLRQDRSELDDLVDDYAEHHAAITAEIRRLAKLDKEQPQPDEIKWVESGQTIGDLWRSLDTPKRHDWLVEGGWKITPVKVAGKWTVIFKPGIHVISEPAPVERMSFPSDSPFYLAWDMNAAGNPVA